MNRIVLRRALSEIARIPAWVEKLVIHPPPNESVQFAINLCLEEAISNVIRHGYVSGEADSQVMLEFAQPREGYLVFTIEDDLGQQIEAGGGVDVGQEVIEAVR